MMNPQTTRVRATTNSGLDRYKQGEPKAGVSRSFVNNVRLQIQAKMRSKIRTEQLRGKLNKRALIRPVLPPVDGGKWNARIFSKREEHTKVNTAVTVLVDISGSMSGTKLALASQSVCLLANVFARAIKIPLEIIAFTYGLGSKVQMAVIKDFTRGTYSDSDMAARIAAAFSHGGKGNDDANALMWAYARLIKRNEPRKILIVLSDGSPADDPLGQDSDWGLSVVTDTIRRQNKVELYGIGIFDDNVKRYYGKNAQVIESAAGLEKALIKTLSEHVLIS